jgi:hypothetical protein
LHYTIYQIVNKTNGKVYIGKHVTDDLNDGYMGSGKLIKRAIKKHGSANFFKTIIAVYDNELLMNAAEKFMVAVDPDTSYNICPGGQGGFGYINENILTTEHRRLGQQKSQIAIKKRLDSNNEFRIKMANMGTKSISHYNNDVRLGIKPKPKRFLGKQHTKETKQKMSTSASGRTGIKSSQFGTYWITNGIESKKLKASENIPDGWYKGRVM